MAKNYPFKEREREIERERERKSKCGTDEASGKQHGVEWDVVLPHKHVQRHVLRIRPPLLPLIRITLRDGEVSDRCIIPHIKHLMRGRKEKKR